MGAIPFSLGMCTIIGPLLLYLLQACSMEPFK